MTSPLTDAEIDELERLRRVATPMRANDTKYHRWGRHAWEAQPKLLSSLRASRRAAEAANSMLREAQEAIVQRRLGPTLRAPGWMEREAWLMERIAALDGSASGAREGK